MTTVLYCYILFVEGKPTYCAEVEENTKKMKIIVDHTSMQPIYEQIVEQIKSRSCRNPAGGAPLDSVRMLAKDLKVSALTVKKGI